MRAGPFADLDGYSIAESDSRWPLLNAKQENWARQLIGAVVQMQRVLFEPSLKSRAL
jgi:hypothetical protein